MAADNGVPMAEVGVAGSPASPGNEVFSARQVFIIVICFFNTFSSDVFRKLLSIFG